MAGKATGKFGKCNVCARVIGITIEDRMNKHGFSMHNPTGAGCSESGTFNYVECKKPKRKLSMPQQIKLLREVLEAMQKTYREPNSDYYERCNGCGRSPHNVPAHADDCLVPRIANVLEKTK